MLKFDPTTHTYTYNGVYVPNVTTVLDFLQDFSAIPEHVLKAAGEFGKHVHVATELYDRGELDEVSLSPALIPYLDGYKSFLDDSGFKAIEVEKIVHSKKYGYCGTLDRTGILNKFDSIVDLKSTAAISKVTAHQLAAYEQANAESGGFTKAKRYTLHLNPKYTRGYNLIPHTNKSDLNGFLACLTVFNLRRKYCGK